MAGDYRVLGVRVIQPPEGSTDITIEIGLKRIATGQNSVLTLTAQQSDLSAPDSIQTLATAENPDIDWDL